MTKNIFTWLTFLGLVIAAYGTGGILNIEPMSTKLSLTVGMAVTAMILKDILVLLLNRSVGVKCMETKSKDMASIAKCQQKVGIYSLILSIIIVWGVAYYIFVK